MLCDFLQDAVERITYIHFVWPSVFIPAEQQPTNVEGSQTCIFSLKIGFIFLLHVFHSQEYLKTTLQMTEGATIKHQGIRFLQKSTTNARAYIYKSSE